MKSAIRVPSITALIAALSSMSVAPAAASPPPDADAGEVGEEEEEEDEDVFEPMRDDPRAVHARSWRNAGVALIVVGTVVGGGAFAIGFADPCHPEPGNDCRLGDRRRAALAVGVPAAVVFAAGWTTFGIGHSRLRRLRLSFSAGRDGGSLFLQGRF